ncbi:hypothetical protein HAX54_046477 [Datura stramonium]|uniref:Uncharacterized protein n=1 Tax=Datura stramonium TaxID=4076 RepID=A0ABS8WJ89_DATST|nr:hypothetical protein [Datura stramonium]
MDIVKAGQYGEKATDLCKNEGSLDTPGRFVLHADLDGNKEPLLLHLELWLMVCAKHTGGKQSHLWMLLLAKDYAANHIVKDTITMVLQGLLDEALHNPRGNETMLAKHMASQYLRNLTFRQRSTCERELNEPLLAHTYSGNKYRATTQATPSVQVTQTASSSVHRRRGVTRSDQDASSSRCCSSVDSFKGR